MNIKRIVTNIYINRIIIVKVIALSIIVLSAIIFIHHEYSLANNINIRKYPKKVSNAENLTIHFINVGQADCILIQQGESSMIIDAGNDEDSNLVLRYIDSQGINNFDYVIGSHAHKDHIGGLDNVINTYDINKVIFPRQVHTTEVFESFISSVSAKGLNLHFSNVGELFYLGNAKFEFMAPNSSSYKKANDYSIVIKLTYGNNTFLFTGDAELVSESEMLANELDITADLIKIGHHGGNSSTSQLFLNKVNPKYAVITSLSNKYGYPSYSVLSRLKKANVDTYRTNEYGNIVVISDGNNISFYSNND